LLLDARSHAFDADALLLDGLGDLLHSLGSLHHLFHCAPSSVAQALALDFVELHQSVELAFHLFLAVATLHALVL
jgi:hypothetical protein